MFYYFITQTLIGVFADNDAYIYKNFKLNVGAYPHCINGPYGQLVLAIASISIIVALVTALINWVILCTVATIDKLILGALVPFDTDFVIYKSFILLVLQY